MSTPTEPQPKKRPRGRGVDVTSMVEGFMPSAAAPTAPAPAPTPAPMPTPTPAPAPYSTPSVRTSDQPANHTQPRSAAPRPSPPPGPSRADTPSAPGRFRHTPTPSATRSATPSATMSASPLHEGAEIDTVLNIGCFIVRGRLATQYRGLHEAWRQGLEDEEKDLRDSITHVEYLDKADAELLSSNKYWRDQVLGYLGARPGCYDELDLLDGTLPASVHVQGLERVDEHAKVFPGAAGLSHLHRSAQGLAYQKKNTMKTGTVIAPLAGTLLGFEDYELFKSDGYRLYEGSDCNRGGASWKLAVHGYSTEYSWDQRVPQLTSPKPQIPAQPPPPAQPQSTTTQLMAHGMPTFDSYKPIAAAGVAPPGLSPSRSLTPAEQAPPALQQQTLVQVLQQAPLQEQQQQQHVEVEVEMEVEAAAGSTAIMHRDPVAQDPEPEEEDADDYASYSAVCCGYGSSAVAHLVNDPVKDVTAWLARYSCMSDVLALEKERPLDKDEMDQDGPNCKVVIFKVQRVPLPFLVATRPITKASTLYRSYGLIWWRHYKRLLSKALKQLAEQEQWQARAAQEETQPLYSELALALHVPPRRSPGPANGLGLPGLAGPRQEVDVDHRGKTAQAQAKGSVRSKDRHSAQPGQAQGSVHSQDRHSAQPGQAQAKGSVRSQDRHIPQPGQAQAQGSVHSQGRHSPRPAQPAQPAQAQAQAKGSEEWRIQRSALKKLELMSQLALAIQIPPDPRPESERGLSLQGPAGPRQELDLDHGGKTRQTQAKAQAKGRVHSTGLDPGQEGKKTQTQVNAQAKGKAPRLELDKELVLQGPAGPSQELDLAQVGMKSQAQAKCRVQSPELDPGQEGKKTQAQVKAQVKAQAQVKIRAPSKDHDSDEGAPHHQSDMNSGPPVPTNLPVGVGVSIPNQPRPQPRTPADRVELRAVVSAGGEDNFSGSAGCPEHGLPPPAGADKLHEQRTASLAELPLLGTDGQVKISLNRNTGSKGSLQVARHAEE
eukprot:gene7625-783_t